jgi:hypothetical protein
MKQLECLPEIAQRSLGGLTADSRLLAGIRIAAAQPTQTRRFRLRPALITCLAMALCLGLGLWGVPMLLPANVTGNPLMSSQTAGGNPGGNTVGSLQQLDVSAGSISIDGSSQDSGTYRNLFASGRSGSDPLVMVGGAVYRMLISPTNMNSSLLGDSLGEVTEYTTEPALSTGGVVSNVVFAGDTVYAIKGMNGALAAANVSGNLRVFQRVSFAGAAVLDGETLGDTLTASQSVTAMELTGLGIVDDAATAQSLLTTLLSNAQYENASAGSDDTRSLLIRLDNGLLLQMMVGEDTISACGTWSCPEFFDAYAAAMASKS